MSEPTSTSTARRNAALVILGAALLVVIGMQVGEARAQKDGAAASPVVVCKKLPFPKYNDDPHYGEMNAALLKEYERGYRLVQLVPWIFATTKPSSAVACFEKQGS